MVKNYFIFSILIVALSMILLINLNYSISFGLANSSFNVKIIHPYKNDTLSNKENILVKGISTYNSSLDCSVSLIVNNKKPYSLATPKGNNGTGDFTKWEFVIDKNVQKGKLIDGINKITAKNYCLKPMSSAFYSIFFNLSSTMDISDQDDVKGAYIAAANASTTTPATDATHANASTTTPATDASHAKAPTKILCCNNLSNGSDNDDSDGYDNEKSSTESERTTNGLAEGDGKGKPIPVQDNPMMLINGDGYDNEKSSTESEKTTNGLAKEIQLQIDYLYAKGDGDDDSGLLSDDDGKQHGNDDGDDGEDLHDIKNTIEDALS